MPAARVLLCCMPCVCVWHLFKSSGGAYAVLVFCTGSKAEKQCQRSGTIAVNMKAEAGNSVHVHNRTRCCVLAGVALQPRGAEPDRIKQATMRRKDGLAAATTALRVDARIYDSIMPHRIRTCAASCPDL